MSELNLDFNVSPVDDECWMNGDSSLYIMADSASEVEAFANKISNMQATITEQEKVISELKSAFDEVKKIALQEREWRLVGSECCGASEVRESLDMLESKIDKIAKHKQSKGE